MATADPRRWMWTEACAMIERAEQLHRQFFLPDLASARVGWEPPIDILGTDAEFSIFVALPGVEPQDIEISIEQDLLTVAGKRDLPAASRGSAIHRLEIPHGRFERRIRLPHARWALDRSTLANGCLFVSLTRS
jgi:HSP20 family molecular chaperone IbpA